MRKPIYPEYKKSNSSFYSYVRKYNDNEEKYYLRKIIAINEEILHFNCYCASKGKWNAIDESLKCCNHEKRNAWMYIEDISQKPERHRMHQIISRIKKKYNLKSK